MACCDKLPDGPFRRRLQLTEGVLGWRKRLRTIEIVIDRRIVVKPPKLRIDCRRIGPLDLLQRVVARALPV